MLGLQTAPSSETRKLSGLRGVDAVREGLLPDVVDRLLSSGKLTAEELAAFGIPHASPANGGPARLSPEQSDRLMRAVRVVEEAQATFGSADKAHRWLRCPNPALDGRKPLDLLDTDIGVRAVETVLGRITHGIAA